MKTKESVMSASVLRSSSGLRRSQPRIEPATDFEHQQPERRIGNRPCLGQRLDADPAEQRWSEEGAGEHVADHLRPAGVLVQPFADQQSDDQQAG
jgi:hypothetical protein